MQKGGMSSPLTARARPFKTLTDCLKKSCRKAATMAAKIISGTQVATEIREEIKQEETQLKEKHCVTPGLVTILVGENPASVSYVTGKQKTAKELGFYSVQDNQPADITEGALLSLIDKYNKDLK